MYWKLGVESAARESHFWMIYYMAVGGVKISYSNISRGASSAKPSAASTFD
jgi:hypothetical protein